jgi:RND family efflux transporter MFP subunit
MQKKWIWAVILLLVGIGATVTLTSWQKEAGIETVPPIVSVQSVTSERYDVGLDYVGVVKAKETKNYAFLTGGKIAVIYVEKGDHIHAGDRLASLETTSLELSRRSAQASLSNLDTSIKAAKISLDTLESATASYQKLYAAGAMSDKEWEAKSAEYEVQKASYENLLGNHEISQIQIDTLDKNINDSTLYADTDGYVMELPYHEDEVVGSGYPMVIAKSAEKIVTIGVSTEDYPKISKSSQVLINDTIKGTVDSIAAYPDEETRTYAVDLLFSSNAIALGETVNVKVLTGKETGCFVPIKSVFTIDGIDYVYVVDSKGKINKYQVVRGEISGNKVRVSNLTVNTKVVTENVENLKENELVTIAGQKKGGAK